MDLSQSYISMCNKAEEIQEGKPQDGVSGTWIANYIILSHIKESGHGDYYHVVDKESTRRCDECGNEETYIVSTKSVWLPRQDQLQEMVEEIKDKVHFVFRFDRFLRSKYEKLSAQSAYIVLVNTLENCSMEMLWLCFVMDEKHLKRWNGKDWVKL